MELESYKDGTLLHIGTEKGGKLQVNDLLAIIGNKGEDIAGLVKGGGSAASQPVADSAKGIPQDNRDKVAEKPKAEAKPESKQEKKQEDKKPAGKSIDVSKMEEVVLMPRLSDTMTEGVIAGWNKNVGDTVKKGDVLAEIETDKATMELESYKNGTLLYTGAKKGEKIAVNDLLAIIGEKGKVDVDAIVAAVKSGGGSQEQSSGEQTAGSLQSAPGSEPIAIGTVAGQQSAEKESGSLEHASSSNGRLKASPLAKKMAAEKGIDLKAIHGSGDGGRIVKQDVDNYKPAAQQSTGGSKQQAVSQQAAPAGQVSFEEVPVSQMRKVIARRLAESKFTAPHFYLTMVIDMDKAVESRAKLNETSKVKISFNDIVLKACAVALRQHPAVNSSWLGDKIRFNHHINIGVAVAVEEGLLVPVVRFADTKSLSQIAVEVKEYAQKARDKKLQPSDWEGNTFTISNLGMFGIDEFTAIINPPDACILAIGGISQVPVVKNGAVVPGNVMKVTLSCDHRVVDGAKGSAFLQTLKSLLEEPLRMLV
jgi:pyruvate dehydrogenase E2 component (dihydrolipoamide acetyltransferase)